MEAYQDKQMSEKKFFSNVAPSLSSGPLLQFDPQGPPPQWPKWPKMDVRVKIWGIFMHVNFLYNFWEFLQFFPEL